MKFKATVPDHSEAGGLSVVLDSAEFRDALLEAVAGQCLGAENPTSRPAEYFVQRSDYNVVGADGAWGVHVTVSGVSRGTREPKQFHAALKQTVERYAAAIKAANLPSGKRCQLFVIMFLDGDIPVSKGCGEYSSTPESEAVWIVGE